MESALFERDAQRVKMLAGIVMRLSRLDLEKRLETAKAGVNPLGFLVLRMLDRKNCTISELGQKLFLASATLVPVIDSMEKDGFVERKSDPEDRRRNPLALTPKGKGLVSKIPFVHKDDLIVKALSELGENKTERLIQSLREMVDYMSQDSELSEKILFAANNMKKKGAKK